MRVDQPAPGWYRRKLTRGGPWVPALIFWRCPIDQESGYPMQRSPVLLCIVNGEERDAYDQWTWLAGEPITEAEWRYLEALRNHAEEHEPTHPAADPRRKIDLLTAPLPF